MPQKERQRIRETFLYEYYNYYLKFWYDFDVILTTARCLFELELASLGFYLNVGNSKGILYWNGPLLSRGQFNGVTTMASGKVPLVSRGVRTHMKIPAAFQSTLSAFDEYSSDYFLAFFAFDRIIVENEGHFSLVWWDTGMLFRTGGGLEPGVVDSSAEVFEVM